MIRYAYWREGTYWCAGVGEHPTEITITPTACCRKPEDAVAELLAGQEFKDWHAVHGGPVPPFEQFEHLEWDEARQTFHDVRKEERRSA